MALWDDEYELSELNLTRQLSLCALPKAPENLVLKLRNKSAAPI